MAQRNTSDALAWLKGQHDTGASNWKSKCLVLQRTARNIPAVYPSALAAAVATPMSERVYDLDDMRAGMVAYCDDPNDGNPYGHIFGLRVRVQGGDFLTWTNDAIGYGRVWCVSRGWFTQHWGDTFQFAARSLNGFDLDLPDSTPAARKPSKHPAVVPVKAEPSNLEYAIHRMDKAISFHSSKGHDHMVRALKKERADLVLLSRGKVPR